VLGVDGRDLHAGGYQQPLDIAHRRHESLLPLIAQRASSDRAKLVGAPVERGAFPAAGACEPRHSDASVGGVRRHLDQTSGLERSQQPAQIARVEPQTGAQQTHLAPAEADLPQQPRLPERPRTTEEPVR